MVAVKEFSWEEVSAPDFENPARKAWRDLHEEEGKTRWPTPNHSILDHCGGKSFQSIDYADFVWFHGTPPQVFLWDAGPLRWSAALTGRAKPTRQWAVYQKEAHSAAGGRAPATVHQ